jgi:ABC-type antimicrobial peptide transport system permease subunit
MPSSVMQALQVMLVPGSTQDQRDELINALHTFINDDTTQVIDTKSLVASMDTALQLLNIFFLVVAIIAIALCFFVLWLSFTANVNENSWEFAVLRSIGITANQVISLYVYEALTIVLSSVILGTIVGLAVAILMTSQFNMFTQLPFTFAFPYTLFFPVLGMSVFIAILGSYLPAAIIKSKPIGGVLKGL